MAEAVPVGGEVAKPKRKGSGRGQPLDCGEADGKPREADGVSPWIVDVLTQLRSHSNL